MQRIKTYKYPRRNIGGDRANVKLFATIGGTLTIPTGQYFVSSNIPFGIANAAGALGNLSWMSRLTAISGLSLLAQTYQRYRIRGVKVRFTFYPHYESNTVAVAFVNAAGSALAALDADTGPTPAFPSVGIANTPELRWSKYRVLSNANAGAKPTRLSVYYSVNKVQGPDAIVKNDEDFTGTLTTAPPYFSAIERPVHTPWMQFGLFTMSGGTAAGNIPVTYKMEVTLYTTMWQKRMLTE